MYKAMLYRLPMARLSMEINKYRVLLSQYSVKQPTREQIEKSTNEKPSVLSYIKLNYLFELKLICWIIVDPN